MAATDRQKLLSDSNQSSNADAEPHMPNVLINAGDFDGHVGGEALSSIFRKFSIQG
ncbi:hypothetical protein [Glaciimonas sp. PAMC28666]|uniref:hypothetical protein n=1 Tax=Glaciimonas sp. PAMC28666 TaxID=2807626 RepID=UPI001965103C|nr:hypothetical protein [Glaciimonas sp. PAMC28666]QRX82883.1 hypothetical protein JQN73_00770 [Glaciimonas sp. PAMC28666]